MYTEANTTFWLMFGGYDAGFLYECKFPQPFRSWGKEEEVEVERIQLLNPVRVVDAEDQAISAMCFNSDGTCVFFGMQVQGAFFRLQSFRVISFSCLCLSLF